MGKEKSEEGGDHSKQKQKKERGGGNVRSQALRESPGDLRQGTGKLLRRKWTETVLIAVSQPSCQALPSGCPPLSLPLSFYW